MDRARDFDPPLPPLVAVHRQGQTPGNAVEGDGTHGRGRVGSWGRSSKGIASFRGIYLMLIDKLPLDEARGLREVVVKKGAEENENVLSNAVVLLLANREKREPRV